MQAPEEQAHSTEDQSALSHFQRAQHRRRERSGRMPSGAALRRPTMQDSTHPWCAAAWGLERT
eukprot:12045716-Alexandrium_andersonii.AAC.1